MAVGKIIITQKYVQFLLYLNRGVPCTLAARKSKYTASHGQGMVKLLEKEGILVRIKHGRRNRLEWTPKGERFMQDIKALAKTLGWYYMYNGE